MKIALSATAASLEAPLDPRFGRAAWFLLLDPATRTVEEIAQPAASSGSGAGIEAARRLAERGVTHVLTGRCGPNAAAALSAAGIRLVEGCSGTVGEVLERFLAGLSSPGGAPPPKPPATAGGSARPGPQGTPFPAGRPEMGRGGRRGMGGGRGGRFPACSGRTPQTSSLEEEAERLRRRLAEIEEHLGTRGPRFRR